MLRELLDGGLGKAIDGVLGRFFQDKDQQAEVRAELTTAMLEHEQEAIRAARDTVVAEAKSEHWITAAWRPLTMLVFAAIIANNYLVAPYADAIIGPDAGIALEMPDQLWQLLKLGIGGYVAGRSAEKVTTEWRRKQ